MAPVEVVCRAADIPVAVDEPPQGDLETDTDEARQATGLEVERDQLSATAGAPHPYLALYDAVSAYDLAAKATP